MVVLHQTEFAILLFNKEDQSGHWGFGGSDLSRFEIFLQKGIQFFLFEGGEQVDLATLWRGIGGELDSVIPWLGPRQFIEGVLGKHRVEVAEVWRDVLFMVRGLGVLSETLQQAFICLVSFLLVFCSALQSVWQPTQQQGRHLVILTVQGGSRSPGCACPTR